MGLLLVQLCLLSLRSAFLTLVKPAVNSNLPDCDSRPLAERNDSSALPAIQPLHGQALRSLKQCLNEIILTSDDDQTMLKHLAQSIGEVFHAEGCCIVLNAKNISNAASRQIISWQAQGGGVCPSQAEAILNLLNHPALQQWMDRPDPPLIISNLQTAPQAVPQTAPQAAPQAAPQPVPQIVPQAPQPAPQTTLQTAIPFASYRATPSRSTDSSTKGDEFGELLQFQAVLACQISFRGQVSGSIILVRAHPYQWTELDMQLLKALSEPIAIAISQVQLEQQVQQQARYQQVLDQLTCAVRNAQDLNHIFQLAIEELLPNLQIDRGLILLLKYTDPLHKRNAAEQMPKARMLVAYESAVGDRSSTAEQSDEQSDEKSDRPPAEADPEGDRRPGSFWVADCRICQQLLRRASEPLVVSTLPDMDTAGLYSLTPEPICDVAPIFNFEQFPSQLLIPLEHQGTTLGSLLLQQQQPRCWQENELNFLKLVAAQISTAIIQSQTLRQVQALVEERTAQLQRSLEVQAKLYEKSRQQIDQLRRMNALREEFLSTLSHELLTPLTSMTLAIRMLRQAGLSPDRQAKYLDILEQQCAQETSLINDLLALQKLEAGNLRPKLQKIECRSFVSDLANSFSPDFAANRLTLTVELPERSLFLYTDSDSLHRIITELLINAEKYAAPETSVRLRVEGQVINAKQQVILTLSNQGTGILPEELPYIFEKFRRGQGVTQQAVQGTGLGLALVKGLAEHLCGAIAVSSQPLAGGQSWETCFQLTLPQSPEEFACTQP